MDTEKTGLLKSEASIQHKKDEELISKADDETLQESNESKGPVQHSAKAMIIGYSLLLLLIVTYALVIGAAQVIGGKTNMFILNLYRFIIQAGMGIAWVIISQHSIKVERQDIYKFALSIIFNYVKGTLFYLAAAVLPVGNMDGTYTGLYVIMTTCVDFLGKEISKLSIIVSCLAVIGVTLLTQPWQSNKHTEKHHLAPCDYIDGVNYTVDTSPIELYANTSNATLEATTTAMARVGVAALFASPLVLGYLYVAASAVSATIASNATRSVVKIYTIPCFFFWSGVSQFVLSAIIVAIIKMTDHGALPMLPNGSACIGFMALFLIGITITSTVANFVYKFLPISKVAVAKPFSVVTLYFAQRTLLSQFYPGHKNVMEIMGIIIIFCAGILSPLITLLHESVAK